MHRASLIPSALWSACTEGELDWLQVDEENAALREQLFTLRQSHNLSMKRLQVRQTAPSWLS